MDFVHGIKDTRMQTQTSVAINLQMDFIRIYLSCTQCSRNLFSPQTLEGGKVFPVGAANNGRLGTESTAARFRKSVDRKNSDRLRWIALLLDSLSALNFALIALKNWHVRSPQDRFVPMP